MLGFLSRFRGTSTPRAGDDLALPFPVTEKSKWKQRDIQLDTASISPPIPRSTPNSLTGFDDHSGPWQHPQPGPSRVFLKSNRSIDEELAIPILTPPPPARVRAPPHVHPMGRSVSSPPTSPFYESSSPSSSSSSIGVSPTKWNLKLHTNPVYSQSTHSLRLDRTPTDLFGYAAAYPLAKQLSPIAEQDYFSPESLGRAKALPTSSDRGTPPASITYSLSNPSPSGSQNSEITRPSPSYSHPFITRPLNRTVSQTSSRTHVSTTSTIPRLSIRSTDPPPSIPPLDLRPPFPGPHPSHNGTGPPLRPRRSTIIAMPTITGSSEEYTEGAFSGDDDVGSLHADSFVTASDSISLGPTAHGGLNVPMARPRETSMRSGESRPSASESFISRRWDRDASLGTGVFVFRAKRQWFSSSTPAFWAFWLGFFCPFLWLIGGWHFTHFGEQPPRLTFWEFYFNAAYWKEKFCGGRRQKGAKKMRGRTQPPLPQWVAEKQNSDGRRARLNDPKRSLRGISFGYPFIPRPVILSNGMSWFAAALRRIVASLEKPHRLFDQLYGVKLREVRGRPESGRRMFDPWIQRCRYAFCYALILLCIGLCTTSTYLIIYNTRRL